MSIVSSRITEERVQIDGRRYVTETHTLDNGKTHIVQYLAEKTMDIEKIMAARVVEIEDHLSQKAIEEKEQADLESANSKVSEVFRMTDDTTLKADFSFTDDELIALKKELNG